ncbi:hypothetical protein GCM10010274_25820 [Streptomyces lavendofoliae]|uniref:TPM domain-containing protein n=1 Tax=Streptomyces lavendofoliae TaxID=67314 RepID=A0A918HWD5_9ACTN|nr:hypothetical protein GCM10010274_25820 [Streptomyces lavendofoliae]
MGVGSHTVEPGHSLTNVTRGATRSCLAALLGTLITACSLVLPGAVATAGVAAARTAAAGPGGGQGSATDLVLPVGMLVAAGAVAAYTYAKRRRRTTTRTTPHGGPDRWDAPPGPTLEELGARAWQALVDTDDAVRTGEEALGFATARSGKEAARPYAEAVAYARAELTEAFRLRQRLDDAPPEDGAAHRRTLEEIIVRCGDAGRRLDADADAFDPLRAPERTAPEALAAADSAFREVSGRADLADAVLVAMRERYAESAAAPVAGGVERARERLLFASARLERARRAVEGGDTAAAAADVRAAEGALAQAARLVDAVDRHAGELAEAAGRLPVALADAEEDLAAAGASVDAAEGVPAPTADLRGPAARAESVVTDVRRAPAAGRYDPIDALRRIAEADAALDEALAGVRDDERGTRRARALLGHALLTAGSAVGAAADHIATHRGAVGARARTRLAEADRLLARARDLAAAVAERGARGGADARDAAAEARRADALARQARGLAEQDVARYGDGAARDGDGAARYRGPGGDRAGHGDRATDGEADAHGPGGPPGRAPDDGPARGGPGGAVLGGDSGNG